MTDRELLYALLRRLRSIQQSIEAIHNEQRTQSNEQQPPRQADIQSAISFPPAIHDYYASEQRERPKKTRVENARLALECIGVLAAIFAGIYTFRTLGQVRTQAESAQKQVAIMQRQLEATDRPWMKIIGAKPTSDLKFSMMQRGSFVSAMIVVGVKNIGKSVALNVTIHARMTLTEDSDRLSREESDVCSGVIETLPVPVLTVFPDDDTKDSLFVYGVERLPAKIEKPIISVMDAPFLSPPDSKLVSPKFVGCASYTYPSSSVTRHSGFRFALEYGETPPRGKPLDMITAMLFRNNQPHFVRYFVVARDIPEKELRVERFFAGFDAN